MRSVLYIDHTRGGQEIFHEVLQSLDASIRCRFASDGHEALELLADPHFLPDYIIVDLNTPFFDSKELISALRESDRLKNTQLILYSSAANRQQANECVRFGAIDFVTKPSTFRAVYENLNKFIPASC